MGRDLDEGRRPRSWLRDSADGQTHDVDVHQWPVAGSCARRVAGTETEVRYHTNHCRPWIGVPVARVLGDYSDPATHRVHAMQAVANERFVYDHDVEAIGILTRIEVAATDCRGAHELEVAVRASATQR